MAFAFIPDIGHGFAEATKTGEDLVGQEGWHCVILAAMNDQQRCLDSVEVEDRGVLDIPFAKLPWGSSHPSLSNFGPRQAIVRAIRGELAIAAEQITRANPTRLLLEFMVTTTAQRPSVSEKSCCRGAMISSSRPGEVANAAAPDPSAAPRQRTPHE